LRSYHNGAALVVLSAGIGYILSETASDPGI
jgi:hypothetical protein